MKAFIDKLIEVIARDTRIGRKSCEAIVEDIKQLAEEFATDTNVGSTGWISVSEGLPKVGTEVIITDSDGRVIDDIVYDYAKSHDKKPCFHRWDDEIWNCYKPNVIAWQPLPEPYQPKGE